jgi:site-specific recombinase XerD
MDVREKQEQLLESSLLLAAPVPLTEHPAHVYLNSRLSPGSRRAMRGALNTIAQILTLGVASEMTLDWSKLRYKHTAALRVVLEDKYAPATTNKFLSALRCVLREALRLELMDGADYARAVDVINVKVSTKLRGRALSEDEILALFKVCEEDFTTAGFRDAALLAILRSSGLRRAEVVNLNLKDFNPKTGALEVIGGKGGKDGTVYLNDDAIVKVQAWLNIRGSVGQPLLTHVTKSGRVEVRRLTPQAILYILQRRGQQAGVTNFSSHDFRRTFISELFDAGVDISTIQQLARHSNANQTTRYDRRGDETLRRAVQKLSIPKNLNIK